MVAYARSLEGVVGLTGTEREKLWVDQGSPIIHLSCEGELGVALESLQGKGDLI